ncbi:hypothetical protein TNCV_4763271 [Trichonephila clavipes]|nr:hypothetical protein TNCV_4763271 [Trichonephila clavipes]
MTIPFTRFIRLDFLFMKTSERRYIGHGSLMVKNLDTRQWCFMSSGPMPLKTHHVEHLMPVGDQTSSRWCGVNVWREGANSDVIHVTSTWLNITRSAANSLFQLCGVT